MHSKVLKAIAARPFVKDIIGDCYTGHITIHLYEGYKFVDVSADDNDQIKTFPSVRAAALGASRNTVKSINDKPKAPKVPRKNKKEKPVQGETVVAMTIEDLVEAEPIEAPYEFVGPLVDLDEKGRPLSMTPNAIRKRKAKAAKAAKQAQDAETSNQE